ncbi:hypothetical protein ACEF17_01835 [Streptococcus hyovaginalis]
MTKRIFDDIRETVQIDFISKNLAEILFRQRQKDNLSQRKFLQKYFEFNKYTNSGGELSLANLKRYEKAYNTKKHEFRPQKQKVKKIFNTVKAMPVVEEIYKEQLYDNLFDNDSKDLGKNLKSLGLFDCIEVGTDRVLAMRAIREQFGEKFTQNTLLEWVFYNAKIELNGKPGAIIKKEWETRKDVYKE